MSRSFFLSFFPPLDLPTKVRFFPYSAEHLKGLAYQFKPMSPRCAQGTIAPLSVFLSPVVRRNPFHRHVLVPYLFCHDQNMIGDRCGFFFFFFFLSRSWISPSAQMPPLLRYVVSCSGMTFRPILGLLFHQHWPSSASKLFLLFYNLQRRVTAFQRGGCS